MKVQHSRNVNTAKYKNIGNFICLDLREFLNNRGATQSCDRVHGNFNYKGNSYPLEEFGTPNSLKYFFDIPFVFPQVGKKGFDNLLCLGQNLRVPLFSYKKIYFLGACDMGSHRSEVCVQSTNGESVLKDFGLTIWWGGGATPDFGEKMAAACSCLRYRTHDQHNIFPRLWLQTVELDSQVPYSVIFLPDNPFMHIFAVTLEW